LIVLVEDLPCQRIEEQRPIPLIIIVPVKVEHLRDGVRDGVKRALADALPLQPIVLDESEDRALIRHGVVYEVSPRPRRNDQQWLSWTKAAAAERVSVDRIDSRQRRRIRGAAAGAQPCYKVPAR
jgi:hypothetical protein